ncbi:helix-turn-helix transcriptional regulator [Sphingomonas oryzagri]
MLPTRIDENELLPALHQGPVEEAAWLVFLTRLRRRARADYAGLLIGRGDGPADGARELFVAVPDGPPITRGFQERYHRIDPEAQRRLRPDRVYGVPDSPDPGEPINEYARAFLHDAGFIDQRMVRVTEPAGANLWLMVARREGPFGAAESTLLSTLAPHLQIALRTLAMIERIKRRAAIAEAVAARLGVGWLTLDGLGRPIEAGGPSLPSPLHGRLAGGIAAMTEGDSLAIPLTDEPRLEMIMESIPLSLGGGEVSAIAFLRCETTARNPARSLIELYDLSPKEAGLAWALCEGHTIVEAAEKLGLTIETARNYSKRIYAKIGARGQADLVRILLTGVAALA